MDFVVNHFSLLIVLICAALPATIDGTASFGPGGMSFGYNPNTDPDENPDPDAGTDANSDASSDADSDASSDASSTTNPPLGYLNFGESGMQFSFNTSALYKSWNIPDNFGCCPSLDRKTKKQNKRVCGADPENECRWDAQCGTVKKCCFDGCREVCTAPEKRCTNSKKWTNTVELRVRGRKVKCEECSCDELYEKDTKRRGFLKAACSRIDQVAKKCCKLCEMNFNLGQHEPCDQ